MRTAALVAAALLAAGCAAARPRPGDGLEPTAALEGEREAGTTASLAPPSLPDGDRESDRDREGEREALLDPGGAEGDPSLAPSASDDALRARILEAARRRLGTRPPLDCSGYVIDAYRAAGVKVVGLGPGRSRSESLYRSGQPVARPRPGDLAFFDDTYDRNHDGRPGDRFTHVALVEAVDGDVVTLLHRGGHVERIRLDLAHPDDPDRNDVVRLHRRGDAPGTRYLSGELLTAFGQLLGRDVTQTLQASLPGDTGAPHPAHHEPSHRSPVRASAQRGHAGDGRVRRAGGAGGKVAAAPGVRRGPAGGSAAVPAPVADGDRPRADADR